jgi:Protein of unknown function (DUF3343)
MGEAEPRIAAVFDSIHYVLAAEKQFLARGLWCDLAPAPREIDTNCGMILEFRVAQQAEAFAILRDPSLRIRGLYQGGPEGLVQILDW